MEVEEALEELFWISVDWVGKVSQNPEINRTLSFPDAREGVEQFLFDLYVENVDHIKARGIPPFETVPFCTGLISGSMHLVELSQASSPAKAAPPIENTMEAIRQVATDISLVEGVGRHDKQLCMKFEAEQRDAMGWPPSQVR